MVRRNWLVRVNPCQFKLQKVACPNEVLSDYFVKVRLWKWSFVRLFYETHTVKVKCWQLKFWMLYCTSVVLSGKLFRIKTCLWPNPISVCCTSPVNWFTFFSRWRFYLLPLTTSGCRIKGEQWALLCRRGRATLGWESLTSSQHARTSWCAPVPAQHVDCIPLQSAWVEPSLAAVIKTYFGPSPDQPLLTELTFDWKQQHSKL